MVKRRAIDQEQIEWFFPLRGRWLRVFLRSVGFIAGVAACSVLGAFCLSLGTYLLDWLFYRNAIESGQYGWTFLGTLPIGAALGFATGLSGGLVILGKVRTGGSVSIVSGCLLGVALLDRSRVLGSPTFVAPYYLPLIWAAILIIVGIPLRKVTSRAVSREANVGG